MSIIRNSQHVQDAIDKLLMQFKDKPKLQALLTRYIEQIQELEEVVWGLYNALDLESAVGDLLDRIGTFVGEARSGFDDDLYRHNIKARIKINSSNGTATDILDLVDFLLTVPDSVYQGIQDPNTIVEIPSGEGGLYLLRIADALPPDLDINRMFYYVCQATATGVAILAEVVDGVDGLQFDLAIPFGDTGHDPVNFDANHIFDTGLDTGYAVNVNECQSPEAGFTIDPPP